MPEQTWEFEWFESLPDACPPLDARIPQNEAYFRYAESNPPTENDFLSVRAMSPSRLVKCTECEARSVSVWDSPEQMQEALSGLAPFRNRVPIEITLAPSSGVVKCTFKKHHYSWWRAKSYDVLQNSRVLLILTEQEN